MAMALSNSAPYASGDKHEAARQGSKGQVHGYGLLSDELMSQKKKKTSAKNKRQNPKIWRDIIKNIEGATKIIPGSLDS